jgi:hypothetical protein
MNGIDASRGGVRMKGRSMFLLAAVAAMMALALPAQAKGEMTLVKGSASINGPGLAAPIKIDWHGRCGLLFPCENGALRAPSDLLVLASSARLVQNGPSSYTYPAPAAKRLGPGYQVVFTFTAAGEPTSTVVATLYPYGPGVLAGQSGQPWLQVPAGQQVLGRDVRGGWWPGLSGLFESLTARGLPSTSPVPIPPASAAKTGTAGTVATAAASSDVARTWFLVAGVLAILALVAIGAITGRPRMRARAA